MTFKDIINVLNDIAWGPWMLILMVGTGIFLTWKLGFLQFVKFGHAMKHTLGKVFSKQSAGSGEVTPFQAVSTALAATVGTGNIAGVTGAIAVGGPGAVFWMWVSALFGMATKYSEVVLAVQYRERNPKGDYVGGPMYYIRNGLGKKWTWLAMVFSFLAAIAAIGTGNMTQINTIVTSFNSTIDAFGGNTAATTFELMGQTIPVSSLAVGLLAAVIVAMVLFGGLKRIGSVAERLVPAMAVIYVACSLVIVFVNRQYVGEIFGMIFRGAFNPQAVTGGVVGVTIMSAIQKGVGRGVFSNEAGLGSAPMAHAATSEKDPVKQGMYGIFEVFMDTIVICTLTALTLLCGVKSGVSITWGQNAGAELILASFGTVFGTRIGALIVTVAITLFALSTILSWSLYGSRSFEFLFGHKSGIIYRVLYVAAVVIGAVLKLDIVWTIADTFNGFMAVPNLIALLGLSGVVVKLTKEYFAREKLGV